VRRIVPYVSDTEKSSGLSVIGATTATRSPPLRISLLCATPPAEIYPLSLHDALPISSPRTARREWSPRRDHGYGARRQRCRATRSEEHTSELQSREKLVCRPLLEKKDRKKRSRTFSSILRFPSTVKRILRYLSETENQ